MVFLYEIFNDDDLKVFGIISLKMNILVRFSKFENEKRIEVKTIGNNEVGFK